MYRVLAVTVVAALATPGTWALDPARSLYQYRSENWSRRNGLPASSVNAITQTKDGYIWLGTQKGVVRFDGVEFTSYSLPRLPIFVSQNISSLAADPDGGLWFGLKEGAVGHFDGQSFAPLAAPWVEPNMQINALRVMRDQSLWVAWNFGFARWRPGGLATDPSERDIGLTAHRAVYEDPAGRPWIVQGDHGVVYYWADGQRHTVSNPLLSQHYIFDMVEDRAGRMWFGYEEGLLCFDAQFRRQPLDGLGPLAQVNVLLVDSHGVLWIGTEGDGLVRYADGKFTRFNTTHGLVNDRVNALYEDAEGNLWVGTRGGLTQLSDLKFAAYSGTEGLPGEVLGVASASGNEVWAATMKGLCRIGPNGAITYATEAGFDNPYIKRAWQAKNGDVYATDGDRHLLIFADGKVVSRFALNGWPSAITEDGKSVIVTFGTEICRVSREGVVPFEFKGGSGPPLVWAMNLWPARDGALWVASHRGIWRIKDGEYRQWSVAEGLSSSVVNWIFEDDDGTLWAGLASGIARLRGTELRCVSRANGLFDNFIYAIVPDGAGWFWCDSSAGVFRVRRDSVNAVADGKAGTLVCESFDGPDSVKSTDKHAQEATFARTADGRLWFPTAGGLIAIDPQHIPVNQVPPRTFLHQVRINGQEFSGKTMPSLEAGRGDLEFHYSALSYTAPERTRYRYQLEGYDEHVIEAGERRSAYYTNLKPGHYRFHVQACNADGVWSVQGDSIEFTLPPHFYQTAWFSIVSGVLGLGSLMGGFWWRTNTLRRRQGALAHDNQLLEAKVAERTSELATMNRQLQDEVAERKRYEHEVEDMNKQLVTASREAGMAEVATSVLHNVGNVLNSANVSVAMMSSHLKEGRFEALTRLSRLLADNAQRPDFLGADEKGKKVPAYLEQLAHRLTEEQRAVVGELASVRKNIEHIKDIVQMQQNYSRLHAVCEMLKVADLVEDAVRLSGVGMAHRRLRIEREIDQQLSALIDKPKVLQILVNFLRNASHACADGGRTDGVIKIRVVTTDTHMLRFEVHDNGVGIAPETLPLLFAQGFTTRKDGHGYGLHSSALAAKSLGGSVSARSPGAGKGAVFAVEIPLATSEEQRGQGETC